MATCGSTEMLIVFDFDHTLVDGNTDTWITKLSQEVKEIQKARDICWTDRMSAIFKKLHEKNFRKSDYDKCLSSLPFTTGMKEVLAFISARDDINCIIVSDSNSYFIDFLLTTINQKDLISEVHTNPAYWDDLGGLCISHHHAHSCSRCPANMCKGDILKSYLKKEDTEYKMILYIGDGSGDYCPTLNLTGKDYVFARENYSLAQLLQEAPPKLKPSIIHWKDGFDVLSHLKKILDS